ncbi:hypothetical protein ACHAPO_000107 [Fusarium lateritium]
MHLTVCLVQDEFAERILGDVIISSGRDLIRTIKSADFDAYRQGVSRNVKILNTPYPIAFGKPAEIRKEVKRLIFSEDMDKEKNMVDAELAMHLSEAKAEASCQIVKAAMPVAASAFGLAALPALNQTPSIHILAIHRAKHTWPFTNSNIPTMRWDVVESRRRMFGKSQLGPPLQDREQPPTTTLNCW